MVPSHIIARSAATKQSPSGFVQPEEIASLPSQCLKALIRGVLQRGARGARLNAERGADLSLSQKSWSTIADSHSPLSKPILSVQLSWRARPFLPQIGPSWPTRRWPGRKESSMPQGIFAPETDRGGAHPDLERAERVLDGLSSHAHDLRHFADIAWRATRAPVRSAERRCDRQRRQRCAL